MRLASFLSILLFAATANAQVVDEILVEGNQRVDDETILIQASSKVGVPLDRGFVEADIKEIYRLGFFEQITAQQRNVDGKFLLVYQVVEKPALRNILVQGNEEVDDETLKEHLNIGVRRFLDRQKLFAGIKAAKTHYQSIGYYDASIDYVVTPVLDNQVDITFRIEEGEKTRLREVVFEGNEKISSDDLADEIQSGAYNWWTSWITGTGVAKKEQIDAEVQLITRYYLNKGFADVRLGEPKLERIEDGLRLTFKIHEGEVYHFKEIEVEGDLIEDDREKTLEGIESEAGEIFTLDTLRKDAFVISEKFTDVGYAFANVEPMTSVNPKERTVKIVFKIDKGELITVNHINIEGNEKTRDNVVRRSLKVNEGELFSSSKIRKSQELLGRLGYFDEVTITPDSSSKPNEVDLTVGVKEGSTGTFSAGAGVSSGDGFLLNARLSENNFLGQGYSVTINADLGARDENLVLAFDDPRVNDSYWSFGFNALSVNREFDDFDRGQKGGSISFGYPLTILGPEYLDDIKFKLRYELLKVKIDNLSDDAPVLIQNEEGTSTSSSITPGLIRNTIDNPLNPTEGSRQQLNVEIAGLGGSEEFWLVRASNTFYYPLVETSLGPIVFSNRLKLDYGDTFDDDEFPLFRRFFPGGINTVRGFDSRELGPKDEDGNEFGGSKQLIGNFEVIFPLFPPLGLRGVAFYDAGNAFDDDQDIEFSDLRHAFGWGIRWNSPLGPIRIEVGYPIDKEDGEKSTVTHFSFGAPL